MGRRELRAEHREPEKDDEPAWPGQRNEEEADADDPGPEQSHQDTIDPAHAGVNFYPGAAPSQKAPDRVTELIADFARDLL